MSTETSTDASQQPNSGAVVEGGTADTAKPEGTASTEGQGSEGKGEGTQDAAAAETDKTGDGSTDTGTEGAPESYEAFTVPEGYTLEGERLEKALALFKSQDLSQAKAQALVSAFCEADGENAAVREQALNDARAQQREDWGTQAKAELGERYAATLAIATTAVKAVNDPALIEAFDKEGWGNHPALIKAFAFFGKSLRDSDMDTGGEGNVPRPGTLESRMYPDMK